MWRGGSSTAPILDPVVEKMRLWHLFAHTSGLTYGFMYAHPVDELYRKAGFEWGMPRDLDLEAVVDQMGCVCRCCSNPVPSGTTRSASTCSAECWK